MIEELMELIKIKEDKFRRLLSIKGLKITEIEGDGNCMFRAISDQVYNGDQSHHYMIRQACMDYIENEKAFFSQFIVGGDAYFHQYVNKKR